MEQAKEQESSSQGQQEVASVREGLSDKAVLNSFLDQSIINKGKSQSQGPVVGSGLACLEESQRNWYG
jgi:hypothetical protein